MKTLLSLFLGTTLGITAFCERQKPNFIVFIADDVSWDDFACYGDPNAQTPEIDKLAESGITFTNTYLTASSCSPSRNSIMTGRYPHNTGAAELHTSPPEAMLSMAEVLKQNGYYCGHSGKFHMGDYAHRGFDVIYTSREDVGDGGEKSWVQSLAERPMDKPFFMWFAAYDAHRAWGENEFSGTHNPDEIKVPYYYIDDAETRQDLAHYYDEIKRFDHYIGLCIQELEKQGQLENTFIIVMADNGRAFPAAKTRVNDRGMKTPFVVSWPQNIKRASTCDSLVSVIDIAPTFFELAGAELPEQFQGRSFSALLKKPQQEFRNYVFSEHNWHDYEAHERMVRSKDLLYILNARPNKPQLGPTDSVGSPTHISLVKSQQAGTLTTAQADIFVTPRPREELYDCTSDTEQWLNIASLPDRQNDLAKMRAVLDEWREQTGDTTPATLTPDYYLPEPGYIKTEQHGTRGENPGAARKATEINAPGPF
ncbi:sulfatase family protein [Pelagicoccus mobilis]|uniref:Sulfatase n=1 Tax=Pelagicoccus mobilis TaxID=415221 RepID=A0A934S6X0_9BACT|nr:sulfatase [Pelagicoccus mobilis]MBK1880479.1 sulfatase [Pelagicoccus mobilis]